MKRNAVAWAALIVSGAALVSSSGLLRPMPAAPSIPAESQKSARALSDAFAAVAEYVKPSVVQISIQRKAGATSRRFGGPNRRMPFPFPPGGRNLDPKDLEEMLKKFFGPDGIHPEKEQFGAQRGEGTGSGFVYDDKGHILTNNHVVESAGKITVTFYDGTEAAATVVGADPQSDVAVIKVENTSYRPLPKGTSGKLRVGDLVMAVGSPFGLSQTVTTGIISATERNDVHINEYESFLQTDAAINPGNSGGPLVDMNGQVVGVNSAIVTGSHGNDGVGFAIPIDMATQLADKLIKDGKVSRARIGIILEPLTPAMARQLGLDPKTRGVIVGQVLKDSPAEKAGLKTGDVITNFRGNTVQSVPTFRLSVAASDAGSPFELTYIREGKEHTTKVVPAPAEAVVFEREQPTETEKPAPRRETSKAEIKGFGLEVQPLTSDLVRSFGLKTNEGVLVSAVKESSPAEAAGIEQGNIITKVVIDKVIQPVKSVKEFEELADKSDELAVYVQAADQPGHFVTLSKAKKD